MSKSVSFVSFTNLTFFLTIGRVARYVPTFGKFETIRICRLCMHLCMLRSKYFDYRMKRVSYYVGERRPLFILWWKYLLHNVLYQFGHAPRKATILLACAKTHRSERDRMLSPSFTFKFMRKQASKMLAFRSMSAPLAFVRLR